MTWLSVYTHAMLIRLLLALFWLLFAPACVALPQDVAVERSATQDERGGVLMKKPPAEAVILFDGRSVEALRMRNGGGDVTWAVESGELIVDRTAGDILSRQSFGDCLLHVEWLSPAGGDGQNGGNSGVKLQGQYEVQILNTPGPPHEAKRNEAGAIYNLKAPDVNASTGPDTWQTFDIWFTAPRWEGEKKLSNARMTIYWNGRLVHRDVEVPNKTGASAGESPGDHPVLFQSHSSSAEEDVKFRNLWVVPDPEKHGFLPPWKK